MKRALELRDTLDTEEENRRLKRSAVESDEIMEETENETKPQTTSGATPTPMPENIEKVMENEKKPPSTNSATPLMTTSDGGMAGSAELLYWLTSGLGKRDPLIKNGKIDFDALHRAEARNLIDLAVMNMLRDQMNAQNQG